MDAATVRLGAKIYDSYPPGRMFVEMLAGGAVIAAFILVGILWGGHLIFGTSLGGILFGALIFIISLVLARPISEIEDRFQIHEHGLILRTFKTDDNPARSSRAAKWLGKRAIAYSDVISIHPFLYAIGRKFTHCMGLRFVLPHPVYGQVAGQIKYSGRRMKRIPEVVDCLHAQMGSLWQQKYIRDEPICIALCSTSEIARLVETGIDPDDRGPNIPDNKL
jgi:hypothetical protein